LGSSSLVFNNLDVRSRNSFGKALHTRNETFVAMLKCVLYTRSVRITKHTIILDPNRNGQIHANHSRQKLTTSLKRSTSISSNPPSAFCNWSPLKTNFDHNDVIQHDAAELRWDVLYPIYPKKTRTASVSVCHPDCTQYKSHCIKEYK
jgi:hypothetical protein